MKKMNLLGVLLAFGTVFAIAGCAVESSDVPEEIGTDVREQAGGGAGGGGGVAAAVGAGAGGGGGGGGGVGPAVVAPPPGGGGGGGGAVVPPAPPTPVNGVCPPGFVTSKHATLCI